MKPLQIFKAGKHTASNGTTLDFGEDQLRAAVLAYDPALHEAPIVVGHPKDNGPAYGWVKSLSFADGAIVAEVQQVDAEFSEMVQAGRFKKRSASWYLPDSPNNPKPGTLYLRHVGFLGAQPPAVKGLKEVQFSEDEGVVEFSDSSRFAWSSLATMMRSLREWMIAKDGQEAADRLLPNWNISDLEAAAKQADEQTTAALLPSYTEEDPMTIEQLQAQVAALTAERDALVKTQVPADFAERETNLAARESAVAAAQLLADRAAVEARVDAAVTAGRLLPAQRKQAVDFSMALASSDLSIDFGEGDKAEKLTQREAYLRQIEAAPVAVDYNERAAAAAGAGAPEGAGDAQEVANKARALVDARKAEGKDVSFTEAVAEVMATAAA